MVSLTLADAAQFDVNALHRFLLSFVNHASCFPLDYASYPSNYPSNNPTRCLVASILICDHCPFSSNALLRDRFCSVIKAPSCQYTVA